MTGSEIIQQIDRALGCGCAPPATPAIPFAPGGYNPGTPGYCPPPAVLPPVIVPQPGGEDNVRVLALSGVASGAEVAHGRSQPAVGVLIDSSSAGLWRGEPSGTSAIRLYGPEGETYTGAVVVLFA